MADLLEKLCKLNGVSGNENKVREYILDKITPHTDNIRIDNMDNIIAFKRGKNSKRTLFVCAHMDEVGMILSQITDEGFLKFKSVGDIDSRNIVSKCVKVDNEVDGILGMKAIHLQKREERDNTVDVKDLYIDIGAKDKDDAKKRVSLGDYISFSDTFYKTDTKIFSKALDSRIACACLIELLENEYENDIYFAFTTQSKVGMRGASVAAYGLDIDAALVIDGFDSMDVYDAKPFEVSSELGKGVCVDFMDKNAILRTDITDRLISTLQSNGIKCQKNRNTKTLTDAGAISRTADGIETVCIGVPVRYLNTPVTVADISDMDALKKAVKIFLNKSEEII